MKVTKRRLEWLGHVAKNGTPNICFFSWLPQPRPRGGPRLRRRDVDRRDLRAMSVSEEKWYDEATVSSARWRSTCREGLKNLTTVIGDQETQDNPANQIKCDECGRSFRRESDKKRHKCISERQKPISEQRGAVQCTQCNRWFRSRGGLSVHHCRTDQAIK